MLRNAWGGLWSGGGVVMLRFLALAHIVDATQRMGGGCGSGGGVVMLRFLALAHMVHA